MIISFGYVSATNHFYMRRRDCPNMDRIGNYRTKPFSRHRKNVILVASEGWRRRTIKFLVEADVTDAREKIRRKKEEGKDISFTAWIIKCLSQALQEHKDLNCYRQGRKKMVVFDDVDVGIPVEKVVDGEPIPMGYIIRRANEKSVEEITDEIRNAQGRSGEKIQVLMEDLTLFERFVLKSPYFVKKLLMILLRNRGLIKKKHLGTVGVTSMGMFSRFSGWAIPLGGMSTILLSVSGVTKKPWVVNNEVKIREILHLVLSFDHDLVDGAAASRFISRFVELLEEEFGL